MATLIERVRVLQGGINSDGAGIAQLRAAVSELPAEDIAARLSSALADGNEAQVDSCLTDPIRHCVLRAAARQLSPPAAEAALAAVWFRMRRRPGRQTQLAKWLRTLVISHAVHLQSSSEAVPVLAGIAGATSAAAAAEEQLLRLSGALDLAQNVASSRSSCGGMRPATLELAEDDVPQVEPVPQDALEDVPAGEDSGLDSEDEAEAAAEEEARRAAVWAPDSSNSSRGSGSSSGSEDREADDDDDVS